MGASFSLQANGFFFCLKRKKTNTISMGAGCVRFEYYCTNNGLQAYYIVVCILMVY